MTPTSRFPQPEPVGDEMTEPKFGIGSLQWPGLAKLAEECAELLQVLGKVIAYPDQPEHPDGTNTLEKLHEEIGDLAAAVDFFVEKNGLDEEILSKRYDYKLDRFNYWHDTIAEQRG